MFIALETTGIVRSTIIGYTMVNLVGPKNGNTIDGVYTLKMSSGSEPRTVNIIFNEPLNTFKSSTKPITKTIKVVKNVARNFTSEVRK
jgi:hypothetical protein